jgi:hypothetical protein
MNKLSNATKKHNQLVDLHPAYGKVPGKGRPRPFNLEKYRQIEVRLCLTLLQNTSTNQSCIIRG